MGIEEARRWAVEYVSGIEESTDPLVRYKDVRSITDIKDMWDSSAALYAGRTAFMKKDKPGGPYRDVTYGKAHEDTDALGTALMSLGLSGKRVAVIGDNRYEWAVSYLAVVCGVGIAVPLDKELPENELKQLVIAAGVECVIFSKKYQDMFRRMKNSGDTRLFALVNMDGDLAEGGVLSLQNLIEIGNRLMDGGNREFLDAQIDREGMGILLFTSGTTGISKGVMLSHKNIAADLMSMVTMIHIKKEDIFFSVLPIHHTYECTCGFLCPLFRGAAVAYCEGLRYIVKNLGEAKPTVFLCVPLIMESMHRKIWSQAKKSGKEKLLRRVLAVNKYTKKVGLDLVPKLLSQVTNVFGGRMRLMICGGAAIDPAVLDSIASFGIICLQGYGLTECGPIAALNPDVDPKQDAAGAMPPYMECRIAQPGEDGIGEICIKGPNVMLGYYGNPEATAEVMSEDGWFFTGDLGYVDGDGFIHITGRKKNVIITKNGKNVFPEEIEYYLGQIPYVEESMVWGAEGSESDDILIFAAVKCDGEAVEEALGAGYTKDQALELLWKEIDRMNQGLPYFKRVKKLDIREKEFEKNTAKKIKRFAEENRIMSDQGSEARRES